MGPFMVLYYAYKIFKGLSPPLLLFSSVFSKCGCKIKIHIYCLQRTSTRLPAAVAEGKPFRNINLTFYGKSIGSRRIPVPSPYLFKRPFSARHVFVSLETNCQSIQIDTNGKEITTTHHLHLLHMLDFYTKWNNAPPGCPS